MKISSLYVLMILLLVAADSLKNLVIIMHAPVDTAPFNTSTPKLQPMWKQSHDEFITGITHKLSQKLLDNKPVPFAFSSLPLPSSVSPPDDQCSLASNNLQRTASSSRSGRNVTKYCFSCSHFVVGPKESRSHFRLTKIPDQKKKCVKHILAARRSGDP